MQQLVGLDGAMIIPVEVAKLKRKTLMLVVAWCALAWCDPSAIRGAASFEPTNYTLTEEVRIGGDDDTVLVSRVADVAVNDDYIFAALPSEATVAIFTRAGEFVGRIGRRGGGPGEFSMPAKLGWHDDALWVIDGGNPRVQFFTPSGALLRVETPRIPGYFLPLGNSSWLAELPMRVLPRPGALQPRPVVMARGSIDGRLDTVAWLPPRGPVVSVRGKSGRVAFLSPVSENAWVAIAPNGLAIFLVESVTSEPARLRVRHYSASGAQVWANTISYDPIRTSTDWYETAIRGRVSAMRENGVTEAAIRKATPRPSHLPPVSHVIAAGEGGIWLRRVVPHKAATRFIVLNHAGQLVGHVEGPPEARILQIRHGRAFGLLQTRLGSDLIVVYRVIAAR